MNKLLVLAAGLAFAGFASATTRRADDAIPSVVVRYGDLDLESQAGVASLHARLRSAARAVCNPPESRILGLREVYDRCVSDTVARGVRDVGNANLSKFHRFGARRAAAPTIRLTLEAAAEFSQAFSAASGRTPTPGSGSLPWSIGAA